jgi:large subunit ribosomal protein L33
MPEQNTTELRLAPLRGWRVLIRIFLDRSGLRAGPGPHLTQVTPGFWDQESGGRQEKGAHFHFQPFCWIMKKDQRGLTAGLSVAIQDLAAGANKPCVAACITTRCLPAEVAGHDRRRNTMREIITLQCPTCKNRNYSTTKNKKTTTGRLEFSKFCNTCRKHTAHKETK